MSNPTTLQLEPDAEPCDPRDVCEGEDDASAQQPADGGEAHPELVAPDGHAAPIGEGSPEAGADRQCQSIAEEKEHGAHGMHAPSLPVLWQTRHMTPDVTAEPSGRDAEPGRWAPIHDLGGRPGFGPVPVDKHMIFDADWERRAFAVTQFSQRAASFNTDAFRHGIEREDPDVYLRVAYFEKWIRNAERMLVEGGVVAPDAVTAKIAGRTPEGTPERTTDALAPSGRTPQRDVDHEPRFAVGQKVIARGDAASNGHTRLPGYCHDREGEVVLLNGGWVYPDTHAHGRGENPTWVYAVRFTSTDLWPEDPGPGHAVIVDLFEPYLEPAS